MVAENLEKIKAMSSSDAVSEIVKKIKLRSSFAVIGGAAGFFFAAVRHKNILPWTIVGILIGAGLSYGYEKVVKQPEEE